MKMTDRIKIPTFLKWAGGKRRILKELDKLFPEKIERYFEPFLGAGSVFFFVKQKYNPKFCVISDINEDLINVYKAVRDNPKLLIKHLNYFKSQNSKDFYYVTRDLFNKKKIKKIKRCAAFIYLNKTCFNGLYRVNSKGEFNVPFGKYTNPEIYNKRTIMKAHSLLQNVTIKAQDYREIIKEIKKGDFVYLDPCYDPLKRTSFANYTPNRFCEGDRNELYKFIKTIQDERANILLSNNNLPKVRKLYSDFKIVKILASRMINSNGNDRGKITELAICN